MIYRASMKETTTILQTPSEALDHVLNDQKRRKKCILKIILHKNSLPTCIIHL